MARAEIDALIEASSFANAARGITGALVVTGQVFFQIIEGPTAEIDALYAKISADPRHTDLAVLAAHDGREIRLFPEWGMRRIALEETPMAVTLQTLVRELTRAAGSEREALVNTLARLMKAELRSAA